MDIASVGASGAYVPATTTVTGGVQAAPPVVQAASQYPMVSSPERNWLVNSWWKYQRLFVVEMVNEHMSERLVNVFTTVVVPSGTRVRAMAVELWT